MKTYKVTFNNGDSLITGFNGSLEIAKDYYLTNWFNFGDTDEIPYDLMVKGVSVVEVA